MIRFQVREQSTKMGDHRFEPRVGHTRAGGSPSERTYLAAVLRVAGRSRMPRPNGRSFSGSKIGRGAVAARALSLRDTSPRARRAFVGMQIVRVGRLGRLLAHLSYIQRDGVARDGGRGRLYSNFDEDADARRFAERCHGDRHQFRFIVSAEDAVEYEDLRPFIRRFMSRMEEDLGTRLDWVAADHLDTLHPHSHVVIRGVDDRGENLIISPKYITRGMRERAAEIANLDLGPKTDLEIKRRLSLGVGDRRLTAIDLKLLHDMDLARIVSPTASSMFDHAMRTGRLRKLEDLGLAESLGNGRWRLSEELEGTLRATGKRDDTLRTMRRALVSAGIDRAASTQVIFQAERGKLLGGRVIAHGFVDEISNRRFLILDGLDGHTHYVTISMRHAPDALASGAIIRLSPRTPSPGEGLNETNGNGPPPIKVELLSPIPLERLPHFEGATWLDRKLAGEDKEPVRDAGFGREVRSALALRRKWLVERGLAREDRGTVFLGNDVICELRRRELLATAAHIAEEIGKEFIEPQAGKRVNGVVGRSFSLASGRFALIESDRDFALVPWEATLEGALGREVSGQVGRRANISWTFARERAIEL